jgi:hypothetical protein
MRCRFTRQRLKPVKDTQKAKDMNNVKKNNEENGNISKEVAK